MKRERKRSVRIFRFSLMVLFSAVLLIQVDGAQYTSPGANQTITPDDVVASGTGALTGSFPNYSLEDNIIISTGDTLLISAGTIFTVPDSVAGAGIQIRINGRLVVNGTAGGEVIFRSNRGQNNDWEGLDLNRSETGTIVSYATISNARNGIKISGVIDTPVGPTITITNPTISNCLEAGIKIISIGLKGDVSIINPTISNVGSGGLGAIDISGGRGPRISGGTLTGSAAGGGIFIRHGGAGMSVTGTTFNGLGIKSIRTDGGVNPLHLASDSIYIANCTFNGSGSTAGETAVQLVRSVSSKIENSTISNYTTGVYLERSPGFRFENTTVQNCATGIHLFGSPFFARAKSTTPEFFRLNDTVADSWGFNSNSTLEPLGRALPIGFSFPLVGSGYSHQSIGSEGDLILFTGAATRQSVVTGAPNAPPEGGHGVARDNAPFGTIAFSLSDDLAPDAANNDSGFGNDLFSPGEPDADGKTASETVFIASWHTNVNGDNSINPPDTPPNRAQIALYPDGRVKWSFDRVEGRFIKAGLYSGLSVRDTFEIFADVLTSTPWGGDSKAFLWDPSDSIFPLLPSDSPTRTEVTGTVINKSTISNNTTGPLADSGTALRVVTTNFANNTTGISVTTHAESYIIRNSDFSGNTTDISNTTTATVDASVNFFATTPNTSGNVTVANPSPAPFTIGNFSLSQSSDGGCVLSRNLPGKDFSPLRTLRDKLIASQPGRLLVALYYAL